MAKLRDVPSSRLFNGRRIPCSHVWWTNSPAVLNVHTDMSTVGPAFLLTAKTFCCRWIWSMLLEFFFSVDRTGVERHAICLPPHRCKGWLCPSQPDNWAQSRFWACHTSRCPPAKPSIQMALDCILLSRPSSLWACVAAAPTSEESMAGIPVGGSEERARRTFLRMVKRMIWILSLSLAKWTYAMLNNMHWKSIRLIGSCQCSELSQFVSICLRMSQFVSWCLILSHLFVRQMTLSQIVSTTWDNGHARPTMTPAHIVSTGPVTFQGTNGTNRAWPRSYK